MSDSTPRTALLAGLYGDYCRQEDSAAFAAQVSQRYTQATLERLTLHGLREIRRGAVLALGLLGDYGANPVLARALRDCDRRVRNFAETGIRAVWIRQGNPSQQRRLALVGRLISAGIFSKAVEHVARLIEQAPDYAEAWNQRALANFGLKSYGQTIGDCRRTLELNPYHFGAAAGMGQAYMEVGQRVSALEAFRRALRLNPDLEAVRVQVVRLSKLVEG